MKRPLVMVGLLYAGGVCVARWAQPDLALLFAVSISVGLLALAWSRQRVLLLWALLPLAGITNEAARVAILAPNDLRTVFAGGPEQIKLRGFIGAEPSARIFERGAKARWSSSARIDATEVERNGQWTPALGRVVASTQGLLDSNYFAGREVIVAGVIEPPRGPLAPGLFNARRFYEEEGVYFQIQTASTNDWSVVDAGQTAPLSQQFETWARRTLGLGLPEEDEPLRLIWTLVLDWKTPLTDDVEEPFLQAGTFHIFAVDGLRIGLVCVICVALLRALRVPRAWCGAVVIPLIWSYTALTAWPASAVRASIMTTVVVLGWAIRRPTDMVNSLFAAAFIILCWDPRQLFQGGFQLSFTIVFCLAILFPPALAWARQRLLEPDPFLPDTLRRRPPEWVSRAIQYIIDMLLLSWTAWLASIPLTAYYFHLFTPWSAPANFVVVPLTALTLMACAGSLVFGAWLPAISVLFNNAAWFCMKCIIVLSQWWSGWRPGSLNMAAPDGVEIAWYYLVVLAIASGWIFRTKWKKWAWVGISLATVMCAVDLVAKQGTTQITALPVGGGSVVFIDSSKLLADSGNEFYASHEVRPFLQAQGVNRLRGFCLTSEHAQQMGGAEIIRTNFAVEQFDVVGKLRAGEVAAGWAVLHPAGGERHPRGDDEALVLRKMIGSRTVLLLSRLGREGQDALLQRKADLRSDIVIAGLPERDEPLSEPLLDAIHPKVILVVDSETPATRRAPARLQDRLGRRGARVFYCREVGALTVALRGGRIEITDATGEVLWTMVD